MQGYTFPIASRETMVLHTHPLRSCICSSPLFPCTRADQHAQTDLETSTNARTHQPNPSLLQVPAGCCWNGMCGAHGKSTCKWWPINTAMCAAPFCFVFFATFFFLSRNLRMSRDALPGPIVHDSHSLMGFFGFFFATFFFVSFGIP